MFGADQWTVSSGSLRPADHRRIEHRKNWPPFMTLFGFPPAASCFFRFNVSAVLKYVSQLQKRTHGITDVGTRERTRAQFESVRLPAHTQTRERTNECARV